MVKCSVCFLLHEGHSHSRTFFSRTIPLPIPDTETGDGSTKLSNGDASEAVGDVSSAPSTRNFSATGNSTRNSSSAGNFNRGGQSKRFAAPDGRGRTKWQQRNGYRKPAAPTAAESSSSTTAVHETSEETVGKAEPNCAVNSQPPTPPSTSSSSPLEIPGLSPTWHNPPLPQRNHQRPSVAAKDQPVSTTHSAPSVESSNS